jgi:hypothetical protein
MHSVSHVEGSRLICCDNNQYMTPANDALKNLLRRVLLQSMGGAILLSQSETLVGQGKS